MLLAVIEGLFFTLAGVVTQQPCAALQHLGGALVFDDRDDAAALQFIEFLNSFQPPQFVVVGALMPQLLGGDMLASPQALEVGQPHPVVPVIKERFLVCTAEHPGTLLTSTRSPTDPRERHRCRPQRRGAGPAVRRLSSRRMR